MLIKGIIVSEELSAFLSPRVISSVEILWLLEEVKKTKRVKAPVSETNSAGGTLAQD